MLIYWQRFTVVDWPFIEGTPSLVALRHNHEHLRDLDHSSAIVGRPATAWAMALNPGANQYTGPAFRATASFMVSGDTTTSVNKGRRAGPMSGLLN